ncbi:MAG TPA: hypothetical protein VEZ50_14960 [Nodosilinea sp.]|nr:hypothetical protein [Nodosilinea sp.]
MHRNKQYSTTTPNDYAGRLSLKVDELAQLGTFLIDRFPDENTSAIPPTVVRLEA